MNRALLAASERFQSGAAQNKLTEGTMISHEPRIRPLDRILGYLKSLPLPLTFLVEPTLIFAHIGGAGLRLTKSGPSPVEYCRSSARKPPGQVGGLPVSSSTGGE